MANVFTLEKLNTILFPKVSGVCHIKIWMELYGNIFDTADNCLL